MAFIRFHLRLSPDFIHLTKASKDGGYDGEILHRIAEVENVKVTHKTLLEAKLRSDPSSVGLRAFAATIVIAFNSAAQTLVVVSNRKFSAQALQQAALFLYKTNMQIVLVDGPTLSGWIRRNRSTLDPDYPAELLDYLVLGDPSSETFQRVAIDSQPDPGAAAWLGGETLPWPAIVEFGWKDEQPASCRVQLVEKDSPDAPRGVPAVTLIGERRNALAANLADLLAHRPGVAVLRGVGGVGKSVVVSAVLQTLRKGGQPTGAIDLNDLRTVRQVFVRTFSELTGINLHALASGESGAGLPAELFTKMGGEPIPADIQRALLGVLTSSVERHHERRDLDAQLLLAFLEQASRHFAVARRPVLVFENLNRGSPEALEFVNALAQSVARAGGSVLIELREDVEGTVVSASQWEAYCRLYRRSADLGEFEVQAFSAAEAEAYLDSLLPGLGSGRLEVIRKRVGHVALFLFAAATWLRETRVVRGTLQHLLVEELEAFFEGISPPDAVAVLDRLIEVQWEKDASTADCVAAAVLCDGRIDADVLTVVSPGADPSGVYERLCGTGLFVPHPSNPFVLTTAHDLLLERMTRFVANRAFRTASVAQRLEEFLDRATLEPLTRDIRRVRVLHALRRWPDVYEQALRLGRELAATAQWAEGSRFLSLAHEAAGQLDTPAARALGAMRTLVPLLEVENQRYRLGLEENLRRLDELRTLAWSSPELADVADGEEIRLRTELLEWRAEFVRERLQPALEIARRACRNAVRAAPNLPAELCGTAYADLGISLKALDRKKQSLRWFRHGIRVFPDSIILRAEELSNRAALSLGSHPEEALEHYQAILRLTDGTAFPLSKILHVWTDLGMAEFLCCRYSQALDAGRKALQMAAANSVPAEEARARNIMGCCYWADGDVRSAHQEFELASLAAERTLSLRYLWRMRTNLACTAAELGNHDGALATARSAEALILEPRLAAITDSAKHNEYRRSRWYVALLALVHCYQQLRSDRDVERLCGRCKLPGLREDVRVLARGEYPDDVFAGSTHVHAGRIMITG